MARERNIKKDTKKSFSFTFFLTDREELHV
jgi:hypothetical protein